MIVLGLWRFRVSRYVVGMFVWQDIMALQVADKLTQRQLIHVRKGKGSKKRYLLVINNNMDLL